MSKSVEELRAALASERGDERDCLLLLVDVVINVLERLEVLVGVGASEGMESAVKNALDELGKEWGLDDAGTVP